MTTGSRYADAPVWELLRYAKERDAALGIVLSRVPRRSQAELIRHFTAMLDRNGLGEVDRFVIPETIITEGMLPAAAYGPIRDWLTDTAVREDRRVAVLTQTMSGVLDTFRTRVPELASHLAAQLAVRVQLRQSIEGCYARAVTEIDEATRNGSLLSGETLTRWQDFAGSGDLLRNLQSRRRGSPAHPRKRQISARTRALRAAVSSRPRIAHRVCRRPRRRRGRGPVARSPRRGGPAGADAGLDAAARQAAAAAGAREPLAVR